MSEYQSRPPDPEAARELGRLCGVGASLGQVLLHRGLAEPASARAYLEPKLGGLTAPDAMADREAATTRLAEAARRRERVVVFGDYDVDGSTSTAILSEALELLGAEVTPLVANRFEGGYGFSDAALDRALEARPSLIVTCDCGSSDHARVARARARGVDVIVVDHHLVPDEPLPAVAFLNPHRPECGFPYKGLASAGLAFSLVAGVRATLGARLDVRRWLDLVALGTVADVAPLDGDNRRLVRAGLRLLSSADVRPGVAALKQIAKLDGVPIGGSAIAFRLAPRLNAAGRLGDPQVTLDLLRARAPGEARMLAARIEQINEERKAIERQVTHEAIAQVEEVYGAHPRTGVVVAGEGWHRGVVGITAARLVDRFAVPAVVIGLEGGSGTGSARTPAGFRLYRALASCRHLLDKFGGHDAAAGLSLRKERVEALRAAFADASPAGSVPPPGLPVVDVELDGNVFPVPRAVELMQLEPVGAANAEPLFALPGAKVEERRVVGGEHLKLVLRLGRATVHAFGPAMAARIDAIPEVISPYGSLAPDAWRGGDAVELSLRGL